MPGTVSIGHQTLPIFNEVCLCLTEVTLLEMDMYQNTHIRTFVFVWWYLVLTGEQPELSTDPTLASFTWVNIAHIQTTIRCGNKDTVHTLNTRVHTQGINTLCPTYRLPSDVATRIRCTPSILEYTHKELIHCAPHTDYHQMWQQGYGAHPQY